MWWRKFVLGCLGALVFPGLEALAERAPEQRKDADLVVTGTVKATYSRDVSAGFLSETYTHFLIAVDVESVEKGQAARGELLYARCFQCTREAFPPAPGMRGHRYIPKEGDRIRAFLNRRGAGFEFVYSDGLDWLDRDQPTADFVREPPTRSGALAFWWLSLPGVLAGAALGWTLKGWQIRKKGTHAATVTVVSRTESR